uniref:Ig-like domain-containing protein n=1 Tax=Knipowitschia caucasica TaxID=637954 RepID=A0AAV2KR55_KNICA
MQPLLSLTLALPLLSASSILLTPHKPGFLLYDTVSLRCEDAPWWTVRRRTSSGGVRTCLSGWGSPGGAVSECLIKNLYPSDIGTYWCESESGEKSATVHIHITGRVSAGPLSVHFTVFGHGDRTPPSHGALQKESCVLQLM